MSAETPNVDLELEQIVNQDPNTKVNPGDPDSAKDIPEKFKNKSVLDLIDMYQNAEKTISKQGSELGELRRVSDELLGLRKDNVKPKEREKVTTEALLSDPDEALVKVIEGSSVADRATKTEERLEALERSIGQREFEAKYPNFTEDVQDPEFQKWVTGNKARIGLLVSLNNSYDFESGISLWDMWNEHKQLTGKENPTKVRETLKQAATVRNSPGEGGSGGRKPIYSRAKLLELQSKAIRGDRAAQARWNDPVFQKEYQEAYAEKRVK